MSEAIVPGSAQANVNRFIDLLLSVDTLENQQGFVHSLATLDKEAMSRWEQPFRSLTTEQKGLLLTAASTGDEPHRQGHEHSTTKPQPVTLRDHFENLKGWVAGAYYSSEPGMRELGWTPDRVFEAYPGCSHLDSHHA